MRGSIKLLVAGLSVAGVAITPAATFADNSVTFTNSSDWTIQELYLSPTKQDEWGPDQLSQHVIKSGQSFALRQIPTGKYDLKIVDEEGDECIVEGVKIVESEDVEIDNENLIGCQVATEEEEDEE